MKSSVVFAAAVVAMMGAADAAPVNYDYAGGSVQVDNSFTDINFNVAADAAELISELVVTLDFTKCDDPIEADGSCAATGYSYNNEIQFILTSPSGTSVTLIAEGDYNGQDHGDRVVVTLDDSAASLIGGNVLLSGVFRPHEALAAFIGEAILGQWTLRVQDIVGADPLRLNDFQLAFNAVSEVPLPAGLLLFPAGFAGLAMARRRARKA